jgi:hypothetical protein
MLFVDSILYKVILVPPIDTSQSIRMLGTSGEASVHRWGLRGPQGKDKEWTTRWQFAAVGSFHL